MTRGWLALAGALLLAVGAAGDRAFQAGRYEEAAAEYRRELARGNDSAVLRYNLGTALLRLGRHTEAREHLDIAARGADEGARQAARYNAGNTFLEPAFAEPPSPERTRALRQAMAHYREALLLDPTDADAKWNLELAQRLLEQQAGGGGGGGGGGEGDDDTPTRPDPEPESGAGGGAAPRMDAAQAERVLRTAAQREAELQQQKLRRAEAPPPNVRDW